MNGRVPAWIKRVAVFGAVAMLGVVVGVITGEAATLRTAPISRFDSADTTISVCTSTTTFVDLPEMTRTFSLGGSVSEEVVVMFQGTFVLNASNPADSGVIQLEVDGVVQPGAPAIVYANHSGTHGFNFVTRVLSPGNHTARIQWRTDLGGAMCVGARSLVILYR